LVSTTDAVPIVRVRAPASTANLGPGFDCLGAALTLSLTVEVRAVSEWPEGSRRTSEDFIPKAAGLVLGEVPNIGFDITATFPSGRGLGFSGAAIACGLMVGLALSGKDVDRSELLRVGTPMEGHPDNLAASLYGGITLVEPDGSVLRFEPSGSVRPLVVIPDAKLSTKKARKALPDVVPRSDAVANIARASGLLAMLTGSAEATTGRLLECTQDLLHQPYRAPLMPRTSALIERLRSVGVAAAVSGAGPSVVCLVLRGTEDGAREACGELEGWRLLEVDWDLEGARIVDA
jgi:homoserine kinase